jgi:hypothetical protein
METAIARFILCEDVNSTNTVGLNKHDISAIKTMQKKVLYYMYITTQNEDYLVCSMLHSLPSLVIALQYASYELVRIDCIEVSYIHTD